MTYVPLLVMEVLVEYKEDKECFQECFYDKELKACGSCYRTLEEIANAGREKKELERMLKEQQ